MEFWWGDTKVLCPRNLCRERMMYIWNFGEEVQNCSGHVTYAGNALFIYRFLVGRYKRKQLLGTSKMKLGR
jgi:hypothetical protein